MATQQEVQEVELISNNYNNDLDFNINQEKHEVDKYSSDGDTDSQSEDDVLCEDAEINEEDNNKELSNKQINNDEIPTSWRENMFTYFLETKKKRNRENTIRFKIVNLFFWYITSNWNLDIDVNKINVDNDKNPNKPYQVKIRDRTSKFLSIVSNKDALEDRSFSLQMFTILLKRLPKCILRTLPNGQDMSDYLYHFFNPETLGYFTEIEAYKLGAIHETLIKARLYDLYRDEPIKFKELIETLKNPDFLNAIKVNYCIYSSQIAKMYNKPLESQYRQYRLNFYNYKTTMNNLLTLQRQVEYNKQQQQKLEENVPVLPQLNSNDLQTYFEKVDLEAQIGNGQLDNSTNNVNVTPPKIKTSPLNTPLNIKDNENNEAAINNDERNNLARRKRMHTIVTSIQKNDDENSKKVKKTLLINSPIPLKKNKVQKNNSTSKRRYAPYTIPKKTMLNNDDKSIAGPYIPKKTIKRDDEHINVNAKLPVQKKKTII